MNDQMLSCEGTERALRLVNKCKPTIGRLAQRSKAETALSYRRLMYWIVATVRRSKPAQPGTAKRKLGGALCDRLSTTLSNNLRAARANLCKPVLLMTNRYRRDAEGLTRMQLPNSALLYIERASRGSGPNGGTYDRHCSAPGALDCERSQIADALTAILFHAEAIRLRNAFASLAKADLDLSVRHITKSAKRVWTVLGDTHETTCICRRPST